MRRVQSVDVTAVHLLSQIRDSLTERDAFLIFSNLSHVSPNGRNIAEFFDQMELTTTTASIKVFADIDDAVEWIEDQILGRGPLRWKPKSLPSSSPTWNSSRITRRDADRPRCSSRATFDCQGRQGVLIR